MEMTRCPLCTLRRQPAHLVGSSPSQPSVGGVRVDNILSSEELGRLEDDLQPPVRLIIRARRMTSLGATGSAGMKSLPFGPSLVVGPRQSVTEPPSHDHNDAGADDHQCEFHGSDDTGQMVWAFVRVKGCPIVRSNP